MKYSGLFLILFFTSAYLSNVIASDLRDYPLRFVWVEKCLNEPVIDGFIDQGEWTGLSNSEFLQTNGSIGMEAEFQTRFFASYNDRFLFIAIECYDPEPEGIVAETVRFDDDRIFYDDRIELFFDVNHDHRSYYHMVINPKGVQYDQKVFRYLPNTRTHHGNKEWNAFWYGATKISEKGWTAEIAIELASLGIQNIDDGNTWGFNIGRVRQPSEKPGDEMLRYKPSGGTEYSAWKLVNPGIAEYPTNFYEPMEFGDMVFGNTGIEIKTISFPNLDYRMGAGGAWSPRGSITTFGYNPLVIDFSRIEHPKLLAEVNVYIPKEGGILKENTGAIKAWSETSEVGTDGNEIGLKYFIQHDQENQVEVNLYDPISRKKLYHTSYMVNVPPFIEFDFETLYTSKPGFNKPVGYRLKTREIQLDDYYLHLAFMDTNNAVIDSFTINSLSSSKDFKPIFDTGKLRSLPGGNYSIDCRLIHRKDKQQSGHFIQPLTKFSVIEQPRFGVSRENYLFGGASGEAVIVSFPFNARFVFWSKASYVPWWEIDQIAMTNQFVETWGMGAVGCAEPMQDKELRFSTVTIIENSPARVIVRWRYALADAHYYIHANEWAEEYFTFYPDGTGVREISLYANTSKNHQIIDIIYVNPPHVQSFQHFEEKIASIKNLSGTSHGIREMGNSPSVFKSFVTENKTIILETHLKNRMNFYSYFALYDTIPPFFEPILFNIYNKNLEGEAKRGHWPNSRYPVDGYNTPGNDVLGHTGLTCINIMSDKDRKPNRWYMLTGVKQDHSESDILAARSWTYPNLPEKTTSSIVFQNYDFGQRAYVFQYKGNDKKAEISFNGLLYNPALVFEGVPFSGIYRLRINGKTINEGSYAMGKAEENKIILFIEQHIENKSVISIEFK